MLETIRPDITLMNPLEALEFFTLYWERRTLDMLKLPTYNPGGKKKKTVVKNPKVPRKVRGKQISVTKLKQLDIEGLALLKKIGIEL